MDPQSYQRLRLLLLRAGALPEAERAAYLDRACGDDPRLRAEAERLLAAEPVATGALMTPPTLRPEPALPDRCGDFRIRREIGRGGMGVVYEAHDERRDRRVAIKVVHAAPLGAAHLRDRLLVEARAGARVEHENVVRTHGIEAVDVDGQTLHLLVLEYVEGKTLRALSEELGAVPEVLLREIAAQVAAGLGAIHAAGIVHRDLKPENVLITDDQRIRIMDLGIAKMVGTEHPLTVAGQFLGSLHYASPEQCQGTDVTPASDLYALGVLLYELATGFNPFRYDEPSAAIQAHLQKVPPPVADINPDITSLFSEVIATLLAKRPEDRFASADELVSALVEGEDGEWWRRRRKRARAPERLGIAVRRETALRGRDADLDELERSWQVAREGHGAVVLLEGEAGLGKTRLLDAFLRTKEPAEAHLLYGSFPPDGGLRGLSDAVLGMFGSRGLEDALAPYLAWTPRLLPAFAALLRGEQPPAGVEHPRGDALAALFSHLLQALADERPTIWVLDDLHFAPGEARAIALGMARAIQNRRALLILTARPDLRASEIVHFTRLEHARRIQLGRLSPREVIEVLREALGSDKLVDALGAKVAYKSDGIPFFIFEMIRELAEKRLLVRGPDGVYVQTREIEEIEVPSAVRDLIAGRLAGLSRDERALLDIGAVQGYEFDADLASAVFEKPLVRVLQDLAEIERHHGVVRSAGRRYRFDHHQIQEIVYRDLAPRLREEYHALLADARLAAVPVPVGADAHFVVHHHLRGSAPARAAPHVESALTWLEQRWLNEEALDLLERALPHAQDARRLALLLRKVKRLDLLARRDEQRETIAEALALSASLGDRAAEARALHARGALHWIEGDGDRALDHFRREIALAREIGDPDQEAIALVSIGVVLDQTGRKEEALRTFRESMERAQESGDLRHECAARSNLALGLAGAGRYHEALDEYERSLRLGRRLGDARTQAFLQGSIGTCLWHLGHFEESRRQYEEHLAGSRQIGDRRGEAIAAGNLGLALQHLGSLAEARAHIARQLELAVEVGAGQVEAIARINLGGVDCHLGRLEEGLRMIAEGRTLASRLNLPRNAAFGLLSEASFLDDPERALGAAHEALATLREVRDRGGESRALMTIGVLAARLGRPAEAIEALERAVDLAREVSQPQVEVLCLAYRATLPGGDGAAARTRLEEVGEGAGVLTEMEARLRLGQATGDPADIERSRSLLRALQQAAPEDCRAAMAEAVPLHREILEAASASEDGPGATASPPGPGGGGTPAPRPGRRP